MASLIPNQEFRGKLKEYSEQCGGTISLDESAGTAELTHNGIACLAAIQKGRKGPWIVRYINTKTVTWTPGKMPA